MTFSSRRFAALIYLFIVIAVVLAWTSTRPAKAIGTWQSGNIALNARYEYNFSPLPETDPACRRLTDGIPRTPYAALVPAGKSLTLDLGRVFDRLYKVEVQAWSDLSMGTGASGFKVEISTDGKHFELLGTLPAALNMGWNQSAKRFAPFTARFIRLTALPYRKTTGVALDEVRVMRMRPEFSPQHKRKVAVFKDTSLNPGPGASDPDFLLKLLNEAGIPASEVGPEELADPERFNPFLYDVLVIPYGEAFPLKAVPNFRDFLRNGGSFFSTGGYAFNDLYGKEETIKYLVNGDFEAPGPDIQGWQLLGEGTLDSTEYVQGKQSVKLTCNDPEGGTMLKQSLQNLAEEPSAKYELKCSFKLEGVTGEGFAYLAVYQYDEKDKLVTWRNVFELRGSSDWRGKSFVFTKSPKATRIEVRLGLYRAAGAVWFDDVKVRRFFQVNTADGRVRDGLHFSDVQIGVFDPAFTFKRTRYAKALPNQTLVPQELQVKGPFEGFAAVGMVGGDGPAGVRARWIPLMETYDRFGRIRGPLGAIVCNYAGTYQGSLWAFFGVTNRNLFSPDYPEMCKAFVDIVKHERRGLFLGRVLPEYCSLRQGEDSKVKVLVNNNAALPSKAVIEVEWRSSSGAVVARQRREVKVKNFADEEYTFTWAPGAYADNFYQIEVRLLLEGKLVDQASTGLIIWDPSAIGQGLKLDYERNYFRVNDRPQFLEGCKTASFPYLTDQPQENPLLWRKQFRKMSDNGLDIYGIVGTDYCYAGFTKPNEIALRRLDGVVQAACSAGVVPLFHLGYGPTPTGEWSDNANYNKQLAARYKQVPTLIAHLSGDIPLAIQDNEPMRKAFRAYLRKRYGTDEALQQAWGDEQAKIDEVTLEGYTFNTWPKSHSWDDVKARDVMIFATSWLKHWHEDMAKGAREGNPGRNLLLTSEFWFLQILDQRNCSEMLDFGVTNVGLGDHESVFTQAPSQMLFSDLRVEGRSFTIGEFGAQVHPAFVGRGYSWETPENALLRYHLIAHHMFALGGSMINAWDWKDLDTYVFPWGQVHEGDLADKDLLYTYRNLGVLYRYFAPKWEIPKVWCLIEDDHRYGGKFYEVNLKLMDALDLLSRTHVNFAVANSWKLDKLPESAEVIWWPIPYSPSDETVAQLEERVKAGATLVITGDLSYAPDKRRTRTGRLEALCGAKFTEALYEPLKYPEARAEAITATRGNFSWKGLPAVVVQPVTAKVLATDAQGRPVVLEHSLGKGKVLFCADPVCLHKGMKDVAGQAEGAKVYSWLLGQTPAAEEVLAPEDTFVRCSLVPCEDGTQVYCLYNTDTEHEHTLAFEAEGHKLEFELAPLHPALAAFKEGRLVALETKGEVKLDSRLLAKGDGYCAYLALDGEDLRESEQLLILPFSSGEVKLERSNSTACSLAAGERVDGRFKVYLSKALPPGDLHLHVDEDLATCLLVVAPEALQPEAQRAVEALFPSPRTSEAKAN